MGIQLKSLTTGLGAFTTDGTEIAASDPNKYWNTITVAIGGFQTMYQAPPIAANGLPKAAVVKSIRLVNTGPSAPVLLNLYIARPVPGQSTVYRRLVSAQNFTLTAGAMYVDDIELTLEPGDKLQASANIPNVVTYVISGFERDSV